MNKARLGFTLIELLIVISIAAIIAGAMIPLFTVTKEDARQAKAASELEAIRSAALSLYFDTNKWPVASNQGADLVSDTSGYNDWNGPYVDSWQSDPWDTQNYVVYTVGTNPASLYVQSCGSNGICRDCDTQTTGCDDVIAFLTSDISR